MGENRSLLTCIAAILVLAAPSLRAQAGPDESPEARRILARHCFKCHGPDAAAREAELRLDDEISAKGGRDGGAAIVPGDAARSALIRRLRDSDPDLRMPPASEASRPSDDDIRVLERWIDGGAAWARHWSYLALRPAAPPRLEDDSWCRDPLDAFVLLRLREAGLEVSPPAEPEILLRRAALALTGLPPDEATRQAFLAHPDDAGYEAAIDRMLGSAAAAERLAQWWLDLARYADSHGYSLDRTRVMWPWRDWVIRAFAEDMPFDRFALLQLAGDLLPDAGPDPILATAFNRNHPTQSEGGVIFEEYRIENVADRVDTTAAVFLGTTLACARCHDHKYDPFTQVDYWSFADFFSRVPERGWLENVENAVDGPTLRVLEPPDAVALGTSRRRIASLEAERSELLASPSAQAWRSRPRAEATDLAMPLHAFGFGPPGAPDLLDERGNAPAGRIEGKVAFGEGIVGAALALSGEGSLDLGPVLDVDADRPFSWGAWVLPDGRDHGAVFARMDEGQALRGFDLYLGDGRVWAHLIHSWPDSAIRVATAAILEPGRWHHLQVTYDGSRKARGLAILVDGRELPVEVLDDRLEGTIRGAPTARLGARGKGSRFKGRIDGLRLHDRRLLPDEVRALIVDDLRSSSLCDPWVEDLGRRLSLPDLVPVEAAIAEQQALVERIEGAAPLVMVMGDAPDPRPTHRLERGRYDHPLEEVHAATPAALPPMADDLPRNRLGLARWLTDPENPLFARVAVNRLFGLVFGRGIVATPGDFGSQGASPSHPELLDALARDFVADGYSSRRFLRRLVLSSTFRQSSNLREHDAERDPENRWLARGPRCRLDAEAIRDRALAVSGLLQPTVGGASVFPSQPAGLWEDVVYGTLPGYVESPRPLGWRRSMYTYWKRSVTPALMAIFDAPTRETCTQVRGRTNTPLQALALMNDPTFLEAAGALAARIVAADDDVETAARRVLATVYSRSPRESGEVQTLARAFTLEREDFRRRPEDAARFLASFSTADPAGADAVDRAAWTLVIDALFMTDEFVTRN